MENPGSNKSRFMPLFSLLIIVLFTGLMGCGDDAAPPVLQTSTGGDVEGSVEDGTGSVEMDDSEVSPSWTEVSDVELDGNEEPSPEDVEIVEEEEDVTLDVVEDDGMDGEDMADVDWGPDPTCLFPYGETVTVRVMEDDSPVAAYPVAHPAVASISYVYDGVDKLTAVDETGEVWWESAVGLRTIFGGFDFDMDGWPDVGLIQEEVTEELCGSEPINERAIEFVSGMTGEVFVPMSPLADHCSEPIDPEETPVLTAQWTERSVLFGLSQGLLAMSPSLASNAWFLQYEEGWNLNSFVFPSSPAFDAAYPGGAEATMWETGNAYVEGAHQANGLVVESSAGSRLVFFTSGRVIQYKYGAYGAEQLLVDHPFLSGNRKDLDGRSEGLVAQDPASPEKLVLMAGTDAFTLFLDRITGKQEADPWGGTERHIAVYDVETDLLDDRFFSNAKDGQNAYQYEGRVVYPANPFVAPVEEETPSRIAYNVFEEGRWHLHISEPGSTEDLTVLKGLFLWNIQDLDGNGTPEWVISPTDSGDGVVETPAYLPVWETQLYQWSEENLELLLAGKFEGVIPYLLPTFRTGSVTSSRGALYPLLVQEQDCKLSLATRSGTGGSIEWIPIGQ